MTEPGFATLLAEGFGSAAYTGSKPNFFATSATGMACLRLSFVHDRMRKLGRVDLSFGYAVALYGPAGPAEAVSMRRIQWP